MWRKRAHLPRHASPRQKAGQQQLLTGLPLLGPSSERCFQNHFHQAPLRVTHLQAVGLASVQAPILSRQG